jgi:acyl carrier protein
MARYDAKAAAMNAVSQARILLAEAANCDPATIPDDVRLGQFELWDSLSHLRLVLGIEQRLSRQLDPEEAVGIETLADIARLVESRP